MIEFLQSIRSDLFSRRLLPFLALAAVALIAAVGYVVTGGSNSSTPTASPSAPSAPVAIGKTGLSVTIASANPNEAVSETPGGTRYQSQGPTRDPFVALSSPKTAKTATSTTTTSSTSSSSGKSGSSSSEGSSSGKSGSSSGGTSGEEQKAGTPTPKKPVKPHFSYVVSVLFGRASTTPGVPATLTPYTPLKLLQPLPSKQDVRISFERVTADLKGAVFRLVVPPILRGPGSCLPNGLECEMIDVEIGHTEELEYLEATGLAVVYELKVVSITKSGGANAARVAHGAKAALAGDKVKASLAIGSASSIQAQSK